MLKYMPTFVGILTFISIINTTSESLKARKVFILSFLALLVVEISCSVELNMKKSFVTLMPGLF